MFKLKLQPAATHFQESSFDLYILQRPWMGHKVEHRTFPPRPAPLFYLIYSTPQISNRKATEVSSDQNYHCTVTEVIFCGSSPLQYSVTGGLGLGFSKIQSDPNFICNFRFVFVYVCFCKYFIYTNIYIYIHICLCVYIYYVCIHIYIRKIDTEMLIVITFYSSRSICDFPFSSWFFFFCLSTASNFSILSLTFAERKISNTPYVYFFSLNLISKRISSTWQKSNEYRKISFKARATGHKSKTQQR